MKKDYDEKLEQLAKDADKEQDFEKLDELEKDLELDQKEPDEKEGESQLEKTIEKLPGAAAETLNPNSTLNQ